jgi:hypothetical protein
MAAPLVDLPHQDRDDKTPLDRTVRIQPDLGQFEPHVHYVASDDLDPTAVM